MKLFDIDLETLIIPAIVLGLIYLFYKQTKQSYYVKSYQGVGHPTGPAPAPTVGGSITTAAAMQTSDTLNVGNAGGIVIIIPNEGHHGPTDAQTQFPNNGVFTPVNAIVPTGCDIVFLSDDEGHSHVISMGALGNTKSISVNGSSAPVKATTPGKFAISSTSYATEGQRGSITVTAGRATPNTVVGAIWVPQSDAQRYISAMSTAGCKVLSQANASKNASGQNVTSHTLCVYSATGTAAMVAQKLATVTKMTPYT